MFVGSVPKDVVNQLLEVMNFGPNDVVYVCCSGSFRVDLALKDKQPGAVVHSNDVSLLSCAVGKLLVGETLDFVFKGRLEFMEKALAGADYVERVAGVSVALDLAKYKGSNEFAVKHFREFEIHFDDMIKQAVAKLTANYLTHRVDSFSMVDFREHAKSAIIDGATVIAFPPTYKGGYERMYKFLDENTEWDSPKYEVWDPDNIGDWLHELRKGKVRHCVFVDHQLEGLKPITKFQRPRAHPIYLYGHGGQGSSLRVQNPSSTPFRYTPVDPWALDEKADVRIVRVGSEHINFLRNKYLAKGIQFVDGMFSYVVLINGCVAGGFILSRDSMGSRKNAYLLSDFSICRERKLAKLIAMLASSREAVKDMERKLLLKFETVATTVFTDKPVSMKYRGIFKLWSRKPGFLQYVADVRPHTLNEVYRQWWDKYAQNTTQARKTA